jgi:hypothetical protein
MKTLMHFLAIALLISSCKSEESVPDSTELIRQTAVQGTWRITYFYDTDVDETADFTGYAFTFGNNGVLTAAKGSTTHTGSWSVTDSSSDDDSDDDRHFNISFASPADFEDLSDDWDIVSISGSRIQLRDVSGGNGGTDDLVFEKN